MRMIRIAIVGLALAGLSFTAAEAAPRQPGAEALRRALDRQAPQWLKTYHVPSVAVAYIRDGRVAWTAAYGEQSPGVRATDRTLYNVASMTKPITAEVTLRLASRGGISLDEPMARWWLDPDIATNPWALELTSRIALSHQTGFSNWRYDSKGVLAFQWEPGTRSGYSGEGYQYVARYLEKRTGQDFETLARRWVFEPEGMTSAALTRRPWQVGRLATPQGADGSTGEIEPGKTWNAADDLRITVGDYARFIVAVMARRGVSPAISAERYRLAHEERAAICGPELLSPPDCPDHLGFGLGWGVFDYGDETVLEHDGADWGEKTLGYFIPAQRSGLVILTNGANGDHVIAEVSGLLGTSPRFNAFLRLKAR